MKLYILAQIVVERESQVWHWNRVVFNKQIGVWDE